MTWTHPLTNRTLEQILESRLDSEHRVDGLSRWRRAALLYHAELDGPGAFALVQDTDSVIALAACFHHKAVEYDARGVRERLRELLAPTQSDPLFSPRVWQEVRLLLEDIKGDKWDAYVGELGAREALTVGAKWRMTWNASSLWCSAGYGDFWGFDTGFWSLMGNRRPLDEIWPILAPVIEGSVQDGTGIMHAREIEGLISGYKVDASATGLKWSADFRKRFNCTDHRYADIKGRVGDNKVEWGVLLAPLLRQDKFCDWLEREPLLLRFTALVYPSLSNEEMRRGGKKVFAKMMKVGYQKEELFKRIGQLGFEQITDEEPE